MSKLVFLPFGTIGGIVAGLIGKKTFEGVWRALEHEQPPDPKHREIRWQKLIFALLLQGAIFRAIRGVLDHGSRRAFNKLTGTWPGEERPDPI